MTASEIAKIHGKVDDVHTYAIVGGSDKFEMQGDKLVVKANSAVDYERAATENVTVRVTDKAGNFFDKTITVQIDNNNEGNTAMNDKFTVAEDATLTLDANQLLANDIDLDGDNLRITGVTGAEHGTVKLLANGQIEFKADTNYSGPAKFSYSVTDANGLTSTAIVEINVAAVADAANVNASNASGIEGQTVELNFGASLVDNDGSELLSVAIKGIPEGFTLSTGSRQSDGIWNIAPSELSKVTMNAPKDYNGRLDLTLAATTTESATGSTNVVSKAFTVDIAGVNDSPNDIKLDNSNITEKAKAGDVVANLSAIDIDGDRLTFPVMGSSAQSFVVVGDEIRVAEGATFDAISRPVEKITIEVSDGHGEVETREVEIAIANVNDVATTRDDTLVATEDTPLQINPATLLANDFDIDGDKL